jgi:hypothetical protein
MKKIITFAVLLAISSFAFADRFDHVDFEKFKAKKVAYITDAINLTPAEAEKFWPVYNEFDKKRFSIMQERRDLENSLKVKIENLSDDKYIELTKKMVSFHKAEGELFVEYNEKFLKILPSKKVVQLYVAEMEFKGFLLREYKKGEHDNPPPDEK